MPDAKSIVKRFRLPVSGLSRWVGRTALVAAVILLLASGTLGSILAGVWIAWNVVVALTACLWGLFHLGAIVRVRDVAARWAFWPALLLTLLLRAMVDPVLSESVGQTFPSGLMYFLWLLVVFPLVFLLLVAVSFLGAALGLFQGRRRADLEKSARRGARSWWLALLTVMVVLAAWNLFRPSGTVTAAVIFSLPTLTLVYSSMSRRRDPHQLLLSLVEALSRRLVWRVKRGERVWRIDVRGEALGLVAAFLAIAAHQLSLLAPLQASTLLSLIQLRDATTGWVLRLDAGSAPSANLREQIVLLHMDAPELRLAITTDSEAGVQVRIIRALAPLGVRRIVLPMPVVRQGMGRRPLHAGLPPLEAADLERCRADLPDLAAAMREASNVVLALPSDAPLAPVPDLALVHASGTNALAPTAQGDEAVRVLQAAARETGSVHLTSLRVAALPAVGMTRLPGSPPPVPFILFAAARNSPFAPDLLRFERDAVDVSGVRFPLLDGDKLLIDFQGAERGAGFASIPYSDVAQGYPHYTSAPGTGDAGAEPWRSPKDYFAGKIVFLDSFAQDSRQTPSGWMSEMEVLAHATHTLLAEKWCEPIAVEWTVLWTLLFGLAVGHFCSGRNPLQAVWYVAVAVPLAVGFSALAIFTGKWLDPVLPMAATAGAFLLVTQFTFSLERSAKEQNRALLRRFVAPQFVDELLDDPERRLGLGGTRQRVCVLFVDVRGFSQFAEQNTPETVMRVVNSYMEALTNALHAHGGILDKYTGDGLMAIFRLDHSPREDLVCAVRAAGAMQDAARALSRKLRARGQEPLEVGIGMHCGDAVVGLVGNPVHQVNYTALGHTVVVAARLQTLAAGGEVLISEAVRAEVEQDFQLAERDTVPVKGVSAPVRPFLVQSPIPHPRGGPKPKA